VKELRGFRHIALQRGENKEATFDLTPTLLSSYDIDMTFEVDEGEFMVMVGGSSRDTALKSATLRVEYAVDRGNAFSR